ncbi:MAG TPA: putative glycolipid-binding domain-containing protein [Roseiarcus sp.]|nr:putative glycolipid-binding domain-containing protein [Roseiarcus sp.]
MSQFAAWMRLDRPGRDAALLQPVDGGWLLHGAAAFEHDGESAAVAYQVEADARWRTRRGIVSGLIGDRTIQHEIRRDNRGWRLDGAAVEGLGHLVDLDYGFTPATNVLQLSRVALEPGQRAEVPVAWFDLDNASLIELPQTYERRGETSYWYEAPTVPYRALLEIAPNGFVQSYPGLWRLVA